MKIILVITILALPFILPAQSSTTVKSQGSNTNGSHYVPPVTSKTYTTPAPANKPYTPPEKTYNAPSSYEPINSNSGSSGSSSESPVGSDGGSYVEPTYYKTEDQTPDDKAIQAAADKGDWEEVFKIVENPNSEFNPKATHGGGLAQPAIVLLYRLESLAAKDNSILPIMYKVHYVYHMSYNLPIFEVPLNGVYVDLHSTPFALTDACIYLGNYTQAIINFKTHPLYGLKKPLVNKNNEEYADQEKARNYVNYMAGRCYEMLGNTAEAQKALSLGSGFEQRWDELFADGAAERAAQNLYTPGEDTNTWENKKSY